MINSWYNYRLWKATKGTEMHPYLRRIKLKPCSCGSGKQRRARFDARGIFLCYVCDSCEKERLGHYRPDVLTDPHYPTTEPIDEEE